MLGKGRELGKLFRQTNALSVLVFSQDLLSRSKIMAALGYDLSLELEVCYGINLVYCGKLFLNISAISIMDLIISCHMAEFLKAFFWDPLSLSLIL